MTTPPSPPSRLRAILLLVTPLLVGLLWFCRPGQNVGDVCDNRFNLFILEHGYQWLTGQVPHFWDAPMFYPATHNTVAYSVNHIGSLPFYVAGRLAGFPRESAMLVWLVTVFVLNYAAAAFVLLRLSRSLTGAAMGAYFFTFGLPVVGQMVHVQLFPRYFVPLALWWLLAAIRTRTLKPLLALAAAIVAQLYTDMYIGIFLGELLVFWVIVQLALPATREETRAWLLPNTLRPWLVRVAIAVVAAIVLLPMALPYLAAFRQAGARAWPVVVSMTFTPVTLVLPPHHSLLWSWLEPLGQFQSSNGEHRMFIGATLLGLGAVYLWLRRHGRGSRDERLLLTALLTVLLAGILTSRLSKSLSLYWFLYVLPGIGSLRAITRIMLVLLAPLSILLALLVQALEVHVASLNRPWLARTLGPALIALLLLDQAVTEFPHNEIAADAPRLAAYTTALAARPPSTKAFAIVGPNVIVNATDALLLAQDTGIPTVNGYSGNFPKDWAFQERPEQIRDWLDACNRSGQFGAPLHVDDIAILKQQ